MAAIISGGDGPTPRLPAAPAPAKAVRAAGAVSMRARAAAQAIGRMSTYSQNKAAPAGQNSPGLKRAAQGQGPAIVSGGDTRGTPIVSGGDTPPRPPRLPKGATIISGGG